MKITDPPTIFILSGGVGSSAEQVVNTVLAQYPQHTVNVVTIGNIREAQQITDALILAQEVGGMIVHTMVDPVLHTQLVSTAAQLNLPAIDLMGSLISWLTENLGQPHLGQPGLYRQLRANYFERVAAIDYTMAHDDGKDPGGWSQADVVLVGVSRVGKTPLCVYLAVLGWKAANWPLVVDVPAPEVLFTLDARRVIGLTLNPVQLLQYRRKRQRRLGAPGYSAYDDPVAVDAELQSANQLFRRNGFAVVDMTDKTIEQGADEIIRLVTSGSRFSADPAG
jgi:[pyruvate, water dikinase]-phosphate phosphotransferase / [pyruvate, water dikinase] kinase